MYKWKDAHHRMMVIIGFVRNDVANTPSDNPSHADSILLCKRWLAKARAIRLEASNH